MPSPVTTLLTSNSTQLPTPTGPALSMAPPLIGSRLFQFIELSLQVESGTANSEPPSGLASRTHRRKVAWPTLPAPDTLNFRYVCSWVEPPRTRRLLALPLTAVGLDEET